MDETQLNQRLRQTFLAEISHLTDAIREDLNAYDYQDEYSQITERLYRSIHTAKGAARAAGLNRFSEFCQNWEGILLYLKNSALKPNRSCLGLLFDCERTLTGVVERLREDGDLQSLSTDFAPLETAIAEFLTNTDCGSQIKDYGNLPTLDPIKASAPPPDRANKKSKVTAVGINGLVPDDGVTENYTKKAIFKPPHDVRIEWTKLESVLQAIEGMLGLKVEMRSVESVLEKMEADFSDLKSEILKIAPKAAHKKIHQKLKDIEVIVSGSARSCIFKARKVNDALGYVVEKSKLLNLVPLSTIMNTLPGTAKAVGRDLGKQVKVRMKGIDIEMDRRSMEQIYEPLVHLIRNAVDHGIELPQERERLGKDPDGQISIDVTLLGTGRIQICVADDGGGIDQEKLVSKAISTGIIDGERALRMSQAERTALIFNSGLSTSKNVTLTSGRGLGMAIVYDRIKSIAGELNVRSTAGIGTSIDMSLPVTGAIYRAVLGEFSRIRFAIGTTIVQEIVRHGETSQVQIAGHHYLQYLRQLIPIVDMGGLSPWIDRQENFVCLSESPTAYIVVSLGGSMVAVAVSGALLETDILVRPPSGLVLRSNFVSGVCVEPDGSLIPLMNMRKISEEVANCIRFFAADSYLQRGDRKRQKSEHEWGTVH